MATIKTDITKEFDRIINEFRQENFELTQEVLAEVAQEVAKEMARQSPRGESPNPFRDHWLVETKYPNSKYVYNAKFTDNRIPLSNILQYTDPHRNFATKAWQRIESEAYNSFVKKMRKRLKK